MGQTVAFRRLPLGGNALLLAVVIAIEIPIVITVVVPAVVVGQLAALPFPIAGKILLAIMMRFHPTRAGIRRTGPISVVPFVVVAHRVPIAAYPGIICARTSWLHSENPHWWRGADSHSDGELSESRPGCQQCQYGQFGFHDSIPLLSMTKGHVAGRRQQCDGEDSEAGRARGIDRIRSRDPARSGFQRVEHHP